MSNYEKYLKYKNKYLVLKKQIGGNHCTGYIDNKYNLKYKDCETIKNKCKFDYEKIVQNTSNDIEKNKKIAQYNQKLREEILTCKPKLKELLDAGYTILEIQQKINLLFTFPEIVKYNETATKKIVFNDMNELNFGGLVSSYNPEEDKFKFTTCYDKFNYLELTKNSVDKIKNIIGNFGMSNLNNEQEAINYKYLAMILFFARIILSKDKVKEHVVNIGDLGTSGELHKYISKIPDIDYLKWK